MPPTEQHNHTVYQEIDNITHKFYLALLHIQPLSRTISSMHHQNIVIFDRFFLSYILKFKLIYLKAMNNRMKIVFCERGSCIREFGLRLYELGVDGFICDIEHEDLFVAKLKKVENGDKCFPDEMKDSDGYLQVNSEFTVGLYLGKGFTNKEISRITGFSINAVRNHAHWLKKKIGFKCLNDLTVLNQRYAHLDIRSWHLGN